MQLNYRQILAIGAALTLAGCSMVNDDATETSAADSTNATQAGQEPDMFAAADDAGATPVPVQEPPPVQCDPHAYCAGPLVVRSDSLILSKPDDGHIAVTGTLSFENRSNEDLRITLLDRNMVLNLDNGARSTLWDFRNASGLGLCRGEGADCYATAPEDFRTLSPGDSPAKLNILLRGEYGVSLAPTMSGIESGTLTLEAYSVTASGEERRQRISLSNIPVTNQLAQ